MQNRKPLGKAVMNIRMETRAIDCRPIQQVSSEINLM
jgi:hypothetical protein